MAIERLFDAADPPPDPPDLYARIEPVKLPPERPVVWLNMVATADGKTLQGPRGSTAKGLGSATDQLLMRRIQSQADAAIIGAGTLRPGHVIYEPRLWRAVVTASGDLPPGNRFFTDAPGRAVILAPETLSAERRAALSSLALLRVLPGRRVDVLEGVRLLRREFGIRRLLLEGGAALNWEFFAADIVDELFLTVAPKIKGGAHLPTVVDGPGFPGQEAAPLELRSAYRDGSELYLRYRVLHEPD